MPHYKDSNNQLHYLESAEHESLLPAECVEISDDEAEAIRIAGIVPLSAEEIRAKRDTLIAAVAWRYERHARETRLGIPPTDDLNRLDTYVQALADIPDQTGFPDMVVWPDYH